MSVYSLPRFVTRTIAVARVCALIAMLGTYVSPAAAAPRATAMPQAAPTLLASKTDTLLVDQNSDGNADPGDTLRYTVAISNTSSADATGVTFSDLLDPNTSLVPGSTRVSPLAFADAYTAFRDTPRTVAAPGLLLNDTGTSLGVVVASPATTAGGSVAIAADGSFVYTPPAGYTGPDSFSYTATNALGSDSATVSISAEGAPQLLSTSPANNAADFPANASLVVTFDEPVELGAGAFRLECGTAQPFVVTPAGPASSFTIDPVAALPETAACVLTIVAAQVRDADPLDPPDTLATDLTVAFTTTDAAPELASSTPANGASDVAGNATIDVTFSEPVSASPSAFTLICGAVAVPLVASASPATSFSLDPTSDLAAGASCTLAISANQVSDVDAIDPPDAMLADASFSFTIDAAPVVVGTTPVNSASGVAASSNISVQFSESVNATASAFTLVCDSVSRSFALSASPASSFTLDPDADLGAASACTITVLATNIGDADANDP
ncbi:MAG: Ig-like domain-containing protein, partial [Roseiflexaceae bacterium]|nr:Ig-like domain-containing protein [Roseiflexaceae bacterium]